MRGQGCNVWDHPVIGRRQLLQVGGLSLLGFGLSDLTRMELHAQNSSTARRGTAKSVVFIFQSGGPSQFETFDPKPQAPVDIRGEYGTTATNLPGVHFCEYLPKLAQRADRFSIVRTMHHVADREFRNEHNSCHYLLHTGTTELPVGDTNATITAPRPGRLAWPSIGSLVAYGAAADSATSWPAVVEIPRGNLMAYPGRSSGILGPKYDRWGVNLAPQCNAKDAAGSCPNCFSHDDPNDPSRAAGTGPNAWWDNSSCRNPDFHRPSLGVENGFTVGQLENRSQLLRRLEAVRQEIDRSELGPGAFAVGATAAGETAIRARWEAHRVQAMQLLAAAGPGAKNPFDLTQESSSIRDLYGRQEWGQGFLVARRLIEAGVRMVQINLRGWDTHQNAFRDLKGKLLPSIDHCLSGFLDDLDDRGLLDETLVVMCGEMGRTPKISPITVGGKNASGEVFTPGRHHWGDVFPCFFAGGPIRPGRVIGTTDSHGGLPVTEAYTPADLAATIFFALGIGPERQFHDEDGRPYRIYRGQPIRELL